MSDVEQSFRRSSSSDGRGQPYAPRSQSSRIETFFRQNRNTNPKRILTPLLYVIVASIYFYYLLFIDVGSGLDARRYVDKSVKEATAPIYNSNSKDPIKLQPRSLADVTIANMEVALQYHNNIVAMKRRQEQKKEEWRRKKLELKEQREREEQSRETTENLRGNAITSAKTVNGTYVIGSGNITILLNETMFNKTKAAKDADLEYIKKITSMHVDRTPTHRNRVKRKKASSNDDGFGGFLPFLMMVWVCSMCRLFVSRFIIYSASSNRTGVSIGDGDEEEDVTDGASLFLVGGGRDAIRLRRRIRAAQANRRFQRFVDRLNEERVANGERQISADTLRHLVNTRDFNGNDYDQLHSFAEENGPAMGSWFSQVGATDAEINRCPSRTLQQNDELLRPKTGLESGREETPTCSVCLETYREGETVRTIPCFHTFHAKCIDPWLAEKAECPICKHSAIG